MLQFLPLMLALLTPVDCPTGYKCVPEEQARDIVKTLELHNCMIEEANSGKIDLEWQPNEIVVTQDGQVFAKEDTVANLHWCSWHLELRGKTSLVVNQKDKHVDTWGFRLRVKLGLTFAPTLYEDQFQDMLDPVLLLEPFFFHDFHVQVYGGLQSFGLAVGMDITRNADVFIAAGLGYKDVDILPIIGLSLSFN